jgi:hypothetical protein
MCNKLLAERFDEGIEDLEDKLEDAHKRIAKKPSFRRSSKGFGKRSKSQK